MSNAVSEATRELILASASPRRAELLREAGYAFRIITPPFPEPHAPQPGVSPAEEAEALSYFKARAVAGLVHGSLIIAADTIVALAGQVFGKPADQTDARRILTALMDTTHEVITGVTLLQAGEEHRLIDHAITRVSMRRLTTRELDDYLATGAWAGKAGAYGIQDQDDPFVESIEGSFTNVVGLPLELLEEMLAHRPAPT
ncbi:MAG: septum formation protein Maf [bacterium]|nr:septum formation protein Maf [bacterium]